MKMSLMSTSFAHLPSNPKYSKGQHGKLFLKTNLLAAQRSKYTFTTLCNEILKFDIPQSIIHNHILRDPIGVRLRTRARGILSHSKLNQTEVNQKCGRPSKWCKTYHINIYQEHDSSVDQLSSVWYYGHQKTRHLGTIRNQSCS